MTPEEAIAAYRVRFGARPDPDEAVEAIEEELLRRWPKGDDVYTIGVTQPEGLVRVFRRAGWVPRRFASRYVWRLEEVAEVIDWLESRS